MLIAEPLIPSFVHSFVCSFSRITKPTAHPPQALPTSFQFYNVSPVTVWFIEAKRSTHCFTVCIVLYARKFFRHQYIYRLMLRACISSFTQKPTSLPLISRSLCLGSMSNVVHLLTAQPIFQSKLVRTIHLDSVFLLSNSPSLSSVHKHFT